MMHSDYPNTYLMSRDNCPPKSLKSLTFIGKKSFTAGTLESATYVWTFLLDHCFVRLRFAIYPKVILI